jgi:hypothetical protein
LPAPGSSRRTCALNCICGSSGVTLVRFCALGVFPTPRPATRHPLFSTGSRRACSPASSILWDAPTPRRPSRPASVSRADTTVASVIRSPWSRTRRPGARELSVPVSPSGIILRWRRRGLSGSWETPMAFLRALRPRSDRPRSVGPSVTRPTRPPHMSTTRAPDDFSFRGSITRRWASLSTLRRASRPTPRKTRFWLLARLCQAGLIPAGFQ